VLGQELVCPDHRSHNSQGKAATQYKEILVIDRITMGASKTVALTPSSRGQYIVLFASAPARHVLPTPNFNMAQYHQTHRLAC
jgi:hypothetical protein